MYSMTGYGSGYFKNDLYGFKVEIKSINHRYQEMYIRMPRHIQALESTIRNVVKDKLSRGKIEINVNIEYLKESAYEVSVDMALAKAYKAAYEKLNDELNLDDKVRLNNFLAAPDVINSEMKELDKEALEEVLLPALNEAVDQLKDMRRREGENLKEALVGYVEHMQQALEEITTLSKDSPIEQKKKLEERIQLLLDDSVPMDYERLANEVAYFADKMNIDEEIERLRSHLDQFLSIIKLDEPIGRKLDFVVQEMNREINTIGSKANDDRVSQLVIEVKADIEKIREQIQNIE